MLANMLTSDDLNMIDSVVQDDVVDCCALCPNLEEADDWFSEIWKPCIVCGPRRC